MTSKMIEFGFEKGAVFNLPDGRVEVLIEGGKDKVEEFYKTAKRDFIAWVNVKAKDHGAIKEQIGNPGIRFSALDINNDLLVHTLEIYGHSLTFDQIHKGVNVYKQLNTTINKNLKVMDALLQKLNNQPV